MTICKNCQTSLSQGARFCPECGEKVSIFCTSCGASITLGATFCGECGEKIAGGAEPFHTERGDGASISLGVYPSSLSPLKMAIDSIVATGPDREKEYSLCIKFQVGNNSQSTYSSIFISAQIYNSEGFIIQESKEDFDEEIEAGDSAEFETYISSVKAGLLGDSPEGLKVVLNAYATEPETIKLSTVQIPNNHHEVVSLSLEKESKNLELVSGSVWMAPVWDESDPAVVARVCIQNKTTSYVPKAKLTLDVLDKGERSVNDRDSYEELVPGGFVSINVECQIPEKKADGCFADITLSLARQVAAGNTQSSGVEIEASDDEDEEDEDESGSKRIYIKTEPGGKIVFGKLDDEQTDLLLKAIESEDMPEELLDLRSNSDSNFREYEGVINSGEDGDAGNEGIIEIDSDGPVELPKDSGGDYEDGAYLVYLSLSKVSIEFEFEPSDRKFDSDKFTEISVPIDLPDFIEHDLYGHPSFNLVTGYQYDGVDIEEYDGDLVDRGYDDLTAFILVKDGEPTLVYKNFNGEESWGKMDSNNASIRKFDSFTCVRYLVLSENPEGDFLDQLGLANYCLYFKNTETWDKALWIPETGFIFQDDDILEEGFRKIATPSHPSIENSQFQLILQEGCLKEDIEDIEEELEDNKIKFEYLNESDSAEKYGNSISVICSCSNNLTIEIDENSTDEIEVNGEKIEINQLFGSFDEDDTWVLVAAK